MFAKPARSRRGAQVSTTASVPSPRGGINAINPIAGMKSEDALWLSNWWVTPFDAQVRQGWKQWGTGTGAVSSVFAYNSKTGTNKLFCASADKVWDITSQGAGSSVATGKTNGYWQTINFSTSGGVFLYAVNGADKPLFYDGSSWVAVDGVSTPAITGVTTTDLIHVTAHKNRIWFLQKQSLQAWYMPTQAIGGTANPYDMRSLFKKGGYLMAATNWTIDAGQGMDDYLVFVTNKGECAVFKGTDVSSSSTWSLTGIWQLGEPIGRRCFVQYGGDICYVSKDGVALLSAALISSRVNTSKALSARIQSLISQDTTDYGANTGWEPIICPQLNMLLVNVPTSSTLSHQWAMNTISQCWTRFDNINASCWVIFNDQLYFGHPSGVGQFWQGWTDNVATDGTGGENINFDALQSFQSFGNDAQLKRFTMVRPILQSAGLPSLKYIVNVDLSPTVPSDTPSYGGTANNPLWGSITWGAFKWGGNQKYLLSEWQGANAVGYTAALYLRGASRDIETRWAATDYLFERGGIL